jgi:hypothetical protein
MKPATMKRLNTGVPYIVKKNFRFFEGMEISKEGRAHGTGRTAVAGLLNDCTGIGPGGMREMENLPQPTSSA